MARAIWPFLVPLLVSLVIVTLVPSISTWLPNVMFKK
jgi:TRAP-type C4-dicarboxylate transport system permease large subunit